MMTKLCEMIMECRAIDIDDRVVLYGWAAQLEEGNDTAYASKETVAEFLTPISLSTLQRRTKRLVKLGLMVKTGGRKQWRFGWTPVYTINIPMIVELWEAQPVKMTGGVKMTACQIDRQGSVGSMVLGLDVLSSSSACNATGVPPVVAYSKSKEGRQTETVEPKPKPTPNPHAHGHSRSCSKCGETLERDVNHFLTCEVTKGKSTLDEFLGDVPPRPNPDSIGEMMDFDDGGYDGKPLFPSVNSPQAEAARQRVEAERQRSAQSTVAEGRTTPTATPFAQSPRSAAPPQDEFPDDIWDAQGRTKDTPAGRAWAASRGEEIIKPTGITP
jgi:hypothetical protein